MFIIIGYLLVIGAVLGGFLASGGHVGVLIQPFEVLIIFGAAIGSFIAGNSVVVIKGALGGATATLKSKKHDKQYFTDLLLTFYGLSSKIRKEGLLAIEALIENAHSDPIFLPRIQQDHHLLEFICDNLRIIVSGCEINQLEEITDQSMEVHHEEEHGAIKAVQRIGDAMPAFGIVAAVMGVVHTMESISLPPAELGKLIAAALVGTFLGILVSYGFIAPVASAMEQRLEDEGGAYKCVQKGLMCCARGISPPMTAEYMRAAIAPNMRPSFSELESQLRSVK